MLDFANDEVMNIATMLVLVPIYSVNIIPILLIYLVQNGSWVIILFRMILLL